MGRYVCIHGHFYQPPRENAWLEEVELQDSAYPFHDWNERITLECYGTNTASRILNTERKIIDIVNNYSMISFNFGPTLLSWLQRNEADVYERIVEADRQSMRRFDGKGSAMAQCYNHMIMPLSNSRDKRTQIIWGIRDFESRFGRRPEGMWLPETAVDTETLELLAECGISFTILAPHQAKRFRADGEPEWTELHEGQRIDPRRAYRCALPSGHSIALFFYDGPISQNIAFGGVLDNGEYFAQRLLEAFGGDGDDMLVHIATDGETYGHHHRYGDMALAYCLHHIQSNSLAEITAYSKYLSDHPPRHDVEIVENSSWSCIHGIERWRANCGCNTGRPGWHQQWRSPLRGALDWLRDNLVHIFESQMASYAEDCWTMRDEYIEVILDRSRDTVERFLTQHSRRPLSQSDKVRMLQLCEMQRQAMLMYTSCGWFFDEVTGIETMQVLQYAARAIQLARLVSGLNMEESFIRLLERAPSNIPEMDNAATAYKRFIQPVILDLVRVGAHYAVSSIFEDYPEKVSIYSYEIENEDQLLKRAGKQQLSIGVATIRSKITWEEKKICYAAVYVGDHTIIGGGDEMGDRHAFEQCRANIVDAFNRSDIATAVTEIDSYFKRANFSLWHLFKDEQRKIIDTILEQTLVGARNAFRQINDEHQPLIRAMREMHIPLPKILSATSEVIANEKLLKAISDEEIDLESLEDTVQTIIRWELPINKRRFGLAASTKINEMMESLRSAVDDLAILEPIVLLLKAIAPLKLELDLWKSENLYFDIAKTEYPQRVERRGQSAPQQKKWIDLFVQLGEYLDVRI
jgi:alpha-amylase/alpha-mannosidase (GH57 family)